MLTHQKSAVPAEAISTGKTTRTRPKTDDASPDTQSTTSTQHPVPRQKKAGADWLRLIQWKFTQIPSFDPGERLCDEYETTFIVEMQRWKYVTISNNVVLHEKADRLDILFHSVRPDQRLSKKARYLIQLVVRESSSNQNSTKKNVFCCQTMLQVLSKFAKVHYEIGAVSPRVLTFDVIDEDRI